MKIRIQRFASIFLLLTVLMVGCGEESGFIFSAGNVTFVSKTGAKQSGELNAETMVLVNRQADSLVLTEQAAKGMFEDWRMTKEHNDLGALDQLLTNRFLNYEFDWTEKRLAWEGDMLTVQRRDADTASLKVSMENAKGLMLYDLNPADTKVTLAVYGGMACAELQDFDKTLEDEAHAKNATTSMFLTVCDEQLLGALGAPNSGGTGIIIVVDPTIEDDDWSRVGFIPHALDRQLLQWRQHRNVMDAGSVFQRLNVNRTSPDLSPDPAQPKPIEPTVGLADRCFPNENEHVTMVEVLSLDTWAEIERCDAVFTVKTPAGKIMAQLNCEVCDLEIQLLGDRNSGKTVILADTTCIDKVRMPIE